MSTEFSLPFEPASCDACRDLSALGFGFTMAFQPIVDVRTGHPYAYEALVRGEQGQGAGYILSQVNDANRYRFDQACRVKAIELAAQLGLHHLDNCKLSINFLPNAVYRPASCIRATLEAAKRFAFPANRLMFEVTEGEKISDASHLINIFNEYRRQGFTTAIDDFGSGYSGLNLLATFQPQVLKIDMELTRDIDQNQVKKAIVSGVLLVAQQLEITIIAEGIETEAEANTLHQMGVNYMQGYWFARPELAALPLAN